MLLTLMSGVLSASVADAQGSVVLYGVAIDGTNSSLYTIDPETAEATFVGDILVSGASVPDAHATVTGIVFVDDGRLLGSANGSELCTGTCAVLIDIDTATGAASLLGTIGDAAIEGQCGEILDLTFDPTMHALLGTARECNVAEPIPTSTPTPTPTSTSTNTPSPTPTTTATPGPVGPPDRLVRINPANGAAIIIGETSFEGDGNGLAWEPKSGLLITTPDLDALAFHPLTGVLFGTQAGSPGSSLVTGNTATSVPDFSVGPIEENGVALTVNAIAFQGPGGCMDAPLGSCTDAAKASLGLKARRGRLKVALKKLGDAANEFGTPIEDTGYGVCIYELDGDAPALVAGYAVPAGTGWTERKQGFVFRDKAGVPDGVTAVRLDEGGSDGARVIVSARQGVDIPDLPLASDTAVVQVVNDEGACFGASVIAILPEDNTTKRYKGIFPTPSPTATATPTASPSGSGTPSATPTATPSGSGTPSPTPTSTGSVTPSPTSTTSGTPSATATPTATAAPTPTPTP